MPIVPSRSDGNGAATALLLFFFFFEDKFGRAALLQCVPVSRWEQKPSRIRLLSLVPLDFVGGHANSEPRLHFISFKRKIRKKYQAPSRLYDLNELAAPFLQINPTPHTQSTSYLQFSSNNETSKKGKKREVIASWALYLFVFSFFFFSILLMYPSDRQATAVEFPFTCGRTTSIFLL